MDSVKKILEEISERKRSHEKDIETLKQYEGFDEYPILARIDELEVVEEIIRKYTDDVPDRTEDTEECDDKNKQWRVKRRLPCKTGKTVYCLVNGMVLECHVVRFVIYGIGTFVEFESVPLTYPILTISMNAEDLGEYWFFTEKEAIQKLKSEEDARQKAK